MIKQEKKHTTNPKAVFSSFKAPAFSEKRDRRVWDFLIGTDFRCSGVPVWKDAVNLATGERRSLIKPKEISEETRGHSKWEIWCLPTLEEAASLLQPNPYDFVGLGMWHDIDRSSKSTLVRVIEDIKKHTHEVSLKIIEPVDNVNENSKTEKVLEALSDPQWDFRTVDGLKRATKLSEDEINTILEKNRTSIRKSNVPDEHGRVLYTLRSRPIKFRERLAEIRFYLGKYFD